MQTYWAEFLAIAGAHLLAVASPGPDFALVLRQSLAHGRRVAVWASLGIGCGISFHVAYCLLGLGLLLKDSPVALDVVRYLGAALMALLALGGISAALWQHFVAASSTSCDLSLADRIVSTVGVDTLWPAVFAPYASCADAAATLLGVPYEFYSLTLFVVLAAIAVSLLRRRA